MLFALSQPFSLVVLLLSFLVGVVLHGAVQALFAARFGDTGPRTAGRLSLDPRRHLDPFGTIGAALAGLGYARPVEVEVRAYRSRGRFLLTVLSGSLVNLAIGVGALALYAAAGGSSEVFTFDALLSTLVREGFPETSLQVALLLVGLSQLGLGLLSLVPLPPLDGGRLLFTLGPAGDGWRKARHYLEEQNIGTAVVLALLLLPLAGTRPLLLFVVDSVASPLLRLAFGV